MRLGIDASNIRVGGGLKHLKELLRSVEIGKFDIEKIVIWSCKTTLKDIEEKPWLKKCSEPVMEQNYLQRALWQYKKLNVELVNKESGSFLHQFKWLNDNEIGALDERWNWLEGWTSNHNNKKPFAVHYTRGGPWFDEWQDVEFASEWLRERDMYIESKFNKII